MLRISVQGRTEFKKGLHMKMLFLLFISFFYFTSYGANRISKNLKNELELKAELTGRDLYKMNDDQLYTDILSQYQKGDTASMKRALNLMLKKYKQSIHADNAIYLVGYSALEKNRFAEGLAYFQLLLKMYPQSNKAVSAEFAKGIAYRNMRLPSLAQKTFLKVRKHYPGSPESFRSENELKLMVRK